MFTADFVLWCIAYILGLLITGIDQTWRGIPLLAVGLLLWGIVTAAIVPRRWPAGPRAWSWILAGAIGLGASFYLQSHIPHPQTGDISLAFQDLGSSATVTVQGKIQSIPSVSNSDRVRFELAVREWSLGNTQDPKASKPAQGCLYVTVPLLQGTGLHPQQTVTLTGRGYLPKVANNPAGFDFQKYLARQGCFAGFSGRSLKIVADPPGPFAWWKVRQRVLQAQVEALGSPNGVLVSAIVMGNRAVDLPQTLRQDFARAGLAHAIAASGFHVSLLLGCVLWLTQGRSPWLQSGVGLLSLLGLIGITGAQPSILRAVLMGGAGLIGLILDRRTKPLALLLLTAVVLLLFQPLWIWDLGFQLSFLATFGLMTTTAPLSQGLQGLPPRLAELLAVPIAAMIWTLPLLLYQFGVFSPYSLLVNVLSTPLILVISLGGMISGLGAILYPPLGFLLAYPLRYVVPLLFALVKLCLSLPGSTLAVGTIGIVQVALLYGIFLWMWQRPALGKNIGKDLEKNLGKKTALPPSTRVEKVGLISLAIGLALIPNGYQQRQLSQLTFFAGTKPPVLILHDRGETAILNSGGEDGVRYTLLPYLQQYGVNRLTWATQSNDTGDNRDGWLRLWQQWGNNSPLDRFIPLPASVPAKSSTKTPDPSQSWSVDALATDFAKYHIPIAPFTCISDTTQHPCTPPLQLGRWQLELLNLQGGLWQLTDQREPQSVGLLLLDPKAQPQLLAIVKTLQQTPNRPLWLWWTGQTLQPAVMNIPWQWAIASTNRLDPVTSKVFHDRHIPLYWTGRDGGIQWQPGTPLQPLISPAS